MEDEAKKFWDLLRKAADQRLTDRLKVWPKALECLEVAIVRVAAHVRKRPDLQASLLRFNKLSGLVEQQRELAEKEATYLAAFQAAESVLSPFGFTAGVEQYRATLSEREARRHNLSDEERRALSDLLASLASLLPWKVYLTYDADTLGDEDANTFWRADDQLLLLSVEHARQLRRNVAEHGMFSALVASLLPALLTPPQPLVDVQTALVFVSELAKRLGATDVPLAAYAPPTPPDFYRGRAQAIFQKLWQGALTWEEIVAMAQGLDVQRLLACFQTDGKQHNWQVTHNGVFYRIVAA